MAEKGILFIVAILSFVQAWLAIKHMQNANDGKGGIGGIFKEEKTKSDASYTTGIIICTFLIMGYIMFMVKQKRNMA